MDTYCTTAEAAEILGCDPSRVRQLLRDGIISGRMNGRDWLVSLRSVKSYKPATARGYPIAVKFSDFNVAKIKTNSVTLGSDLKV